MLIGQLETMGYPHSLMDQYTSNIKKVTSKQVQDVAKKYLIDEKDAQIIILGCAGMARYRDSLEELLGINVLDPVQASVDYAIMSL